MKDFIKATYELKLQYNAARRVGFILITIKVKENMGQLRSVLSTTAVKLCMGQLRSISGSTKG